MKLDSKKCPSFEANDEHESTRLDGELNLTSLYNIMLVPSTPTSTGCSATACCSCFSLFSGTAT